jgi:WXG100 family type VII secretion target
VSEYDFNFPQAQNTNAAMNNATRQLQEILENLDSEVRTSLARWESDARDAYNISKAKWTAAANRMPLILASGATALGNVNETLTGAEKFGRNLWQG